MIMNTKNIEITKTLFFNYSMQFEQLLLNNKMVLICET